MALLKVRSKAPDFKAANQNGKIVSFSFANRKARSLHFNDRCDKNDA